MARDDLQSIDLTDFTPGISTHYHSTTAEQPTPDGFASAANTWGCCALPSGGLGPLPRHTITRNSTISDWEDDDEDERRWPTLGGDPEVYDHRVAILDAKVISPVEYVPAFDTAVDYSHPPVDVFLARQFWMRRKSGSHHADAIWWFTNHLEYLGPPYTRDGSANFDIDLVNLDAGSTIVPSRWRYGGGSITETRTVAPDVSRFQPGSPVVICGIGGVRTIGGVLDADDEGLDSGVFVSYPDYSVSFAGPPEYTEAHDRPVQLPAPNGVAMPGIVFAHQGRLMAFARMSGYKFARRLNYHGNDDGQRAATELVMYWPVNDVYNANGPSIATYMEEAASGYGTWCSVNANSLLLVKNQGGGVQITGDVSAPSVTRLPGLPSVGGRANRGVMTAKGFVYGTVSGVWLWTGSDSATALSDNLHPLHWLPEDDTTDLRETSCLVGSFAYRYPYVFAPNNYMLDMRGGGWWRYAPTPDQDPDDGITYAFNEVDCNGNLWAFPASYVADGMEPYGRFFEQDTPRADWSWQSQPLARTRNRRLEYRQVTLVASGTGTVEVTVTGIDGRNAKVSFGVDGGNAQMVVEPVSIQTTDVEVTITSKATDPDDAAPLVHRVSIAYREAQSIAGVS